MHVFFVIFAIIAAVAAIALHHSYKKQTTWRGTVTRIVEKPAAGIDGLDTKDYVDVHYETDEGKRGKFRIFRKKFEVLYPNLKAGDRLVKETGEVFPRKDA